MDVNSVECEPTPPQAVSMATITLGSNGNHSDENHDAYRDIPPVNNDDVDLSITQRKKKSKGLYSASSTASKVYGTVHSEEIVKMSDSDVSAPPPSSSQTIQTPTGNRFVTTSGGNEVGEDDEVCPEFQPHAWKKGMCNICFKSQEEHEGKIPDISKMRITSGGGGSLEKRLEIAMKRIKDLEAELREVNGQYAQLQIDFKELDEDCMSKEEELKRAEEESTDIVKVLREKAERLDDENHYLKKRIEDLQPKSIKSIGRGKWK
ncbi:unnamed protein product [Owenia fusiformis]|uniref:Uncharacterized protein n=1 Tax=Owenia fusiformis TaxID=6347 RepID=A0A8J1UC94_OWEFU|nr:unnamed protein product [Owenia fusiformis]